MEGHDHLYAGSRHLPSRIAITIRCMNGIEKEKLNIGVSLAVSLFWTQFQNFNLRCTCDSPQLILRAGMTNTRIMMKIY